MKQATRRDWLWLTLMLVITAVVASTAIRIEWYNNAVGGFLPRPQPPSVEGNDVKWRQSSPMLYEMRLRETIAQQQGFELSEDFEIRKEQVFKIELTDKQQRDVDEFSHRADLKNEFRDLVSSMGQLQYLLVPFGIVFSILALRQKIPMRRLAGGLCLFVNLIAGGLMLSRGYFQSLGW